MQDDRTAVMARVRGRVQGVNYRAWTQAEAGRRGLTGWVRNERDGSVSALIVGGEVPVAEMIAALWRGPRDAAVTDVTTERVAPGEDLSGFHVRR